VRKLRRLTYALVGACALVGLAYTWRAAWQADIVRAAIGAASTLAVLIAGALWTGSLRLAMVSLRTQRRLRRSEGRVAAIWGIHVGHGVRLNELATGLDEARREQTRSAGDLAAKIDADRSLLVRRLESLHTRLETFAKLHDGQAERLEQRVSALESAVRRGVAAADAARLDDASAADWATDESPPGERTVAAYQHLVAQESRADSVDGDAMYDKHRLREDFARLIHRRDYVDALAKGDEIVNRFPDSGAASDFRRVRPHLLRRIQLTESARSAGSD
jgi:hypothetical protein